MIKFKLNKKSVQIPSTWYDPTTEQYLSILEGPKSRLEILAMFIGVPLETLNDPKTDINGLETVISALAFMNKPPQFDNKITEIGKYKLPINNKGGFNIQFESLAQFEDMKAAMLKVPDKNVYEHTKAYVRYCAIYLQKIRDGKYSNDKAKAMEPEIMQLPAYQVIALGGFFFIRLLALSLGTTTTSPTTNLSQKKRKRVSAGSTKRSARSSASSTRGKK